jgi:hypothetical protein
MTQIRRRSWGSARPKRNEGMRLSTMIALFVVVVLLMLAANQPEFWSRFLPHLDQPAPADSAGANAKTAPAPPQAPQTARSPDRKSPLMLGGLIVVAIAYFGWRIARIGRAVSRRTKAKRADAPLSTPTPPPIKDE